jgi:hypothetical protein
LETGRTGRTGGFSQATNPEKSALDGDAIKFRHSSIVDIAVRPQIGHLHARLSTV